MDEGVRPHPGAEIPSTQSYTHVTSWREGAQFMGGGRCW